MQVSREFQNMHPAEIVEVIAQSPSSLGIREASTPSGPYGMSETILDPAPSPLGPQVKCTSPEVPVLFEAPCVLFSPREGKQAEARVSGRELGSTVVRNTGFEI